MKVSLRRAAVIQQEINNRLRNSDLLASSAELTEFHDVQSEMACREDKFANELTLRKQLIGVLFSIREQVGQKNAESGINRLLTNNAQIDRLIILRRSLYALPPLNLDSLVACLARRSIPFAVCMAL